MRTFHVRELVCDEEGALGCGKRERRLPEDHARRRPDPQCLRVQQARAPARAAHLDLGPGESLAGRELLDLPDDRGTANGLEPWAEQRLHDDHGDADHDEHRRGREPPAPPEPSRKPQAGGTREPEQRRAHDERPEQVEDPRPVAELRDPVAPLPPERREPERQARRRAARPRRTRRPRRREAAQARAAAVALATTRRVQRARRRAHRARAGAVPSRGALHARGRERERRERRLNVQPARHFGAPEQERSDDPHRR